MAYPSIKNFSTVLAITIVISCFFSFNSAKAKKGGFSVELIHRDSPNSPFHNPLETPAQRLANAFRRSINRADYFYRTSAAVSPNSPSSTVMSNGGSYIMKLSIGTPPFGIVAIADTGSDLIWTQCQPCPYCYKQDAPLFDPKSSKTYRDFSCFSKQCGYFYGFCLVKGVCQYRSKYGDGSFSEGNLAADTVTLASTTGQPVSFPNTTIGCGHRNGGLFNEKESGIVGLGGGPRSLVRQLDSAIDGKFSYCLVPVTSNKSTSTLSFGSDAVISGKGVVSTPIILGETDTLYVLILEAVSVGNKKIPFTISERESSNENQGDKIIIDSGTTLTLVPESFFSKLVAEVDRVVGGHRVPAPRDLPGLLCYKADSHLRIPEITVHFKENVKCFAFGPSRDKAIYGNLAQSNFLVGYDLKRRTVSFKPADCSKV